MAKKIETTVAPEATVAPETAKVEKAKAEYVLTFSTIDGIEHERKFGTSLKSAKSVRSILTESGFTCKLVLTKEII